MSRTRIAILAVSTMMASTIALTAPAYAAPISVGGNSNWTITSQSSVSTNYPALNKTVTASENLVYKARVLGIPLPMTGYYILSFPYAPFAKPTLLSANAPLNSLTYAYGWDPYMGKNAWVVQGKCNFWGNMTVYLKGSAAAVTKGAAGYVHGGTGTGHQLDVNSIDYIKVV